MKLIVFVAFKNSVAICIWYKTEVMKNNSAIKNNFSIVKGFRLGYEIGV